MKLLKEYPIVTEPRGMQRYYDEGYHVDSNDKIHRLLTCEFTPADRRQPITTIYYTIEPEMAERCNDRLVFAHQQRFTKELRRTTRKQTKNG